MLLHLFAVPLILLAPAVAALWFFGFLVPSLFEGSPLLAPLGRQAQGFALSVFGVLVGAVILTAAYQGFRLWRWSAGRADCCDNCGGMLSEPRDGRYGPYVRCLACGKGRALR